MLKTLLVSATILLATCAQPALAQSVCGERSKFLKQLSRVHSEGPVAMGLVSNGSILEVLASTSGSWTILVTRPDGVSCVVAVGQDWETIPSIATGPQT